MPIGIEANLRKISNYLSKSGENITVLIGVHSLIGIYFIFENAHDFTDCLYIGLATFFHVLTSIPITVYSN